MRPLAFVLLRKSGTFGTTTISSAIFSRCFAQAPEVGPARAAAIHECSTKAAKHKEYVEETTPPPKQPKPAKVAPIKAPTVAGHPGPVSISTAKALATYAPRPQYPYEARSRHITGSGVCVVNVDGSGSVTSASMAQSIGNPILDNAATSAFQRWRFKPGSVSKVKIPITFTMSGASY